MANVLSEKESALIDAYWRAANYLSVGQIYLFDNRLLKAPLAEDHVKPRLLGHWGTTPGLNFIYVHLNRLIRKLDLDVIYAASAAERTSARDQRSRLRRAVHHGQTHHLRLPRLSLAHPPAHLSPSRTRQHPRARLQGGGDDDDDVPHVRHERLGSVPSRHGRRRPRAGAGHARGLRQAGAGEALIDHRIYIRRCGDDMPETKDWVWGKGHVTGGATSTGGDNV